MSTTLISVSHLHQPHSINHSCFTEKWVINKKNNHIYEIFIDFVLSNLIYK
jgi:hypothetical protein